VWLLWNNDQGRRCIGGAGPDRCGIVSNDQNLRDFDQVLAGSLDRATGNRPTVGEVFVIAHSGAVTIEVVGDCVERFAFRTGEATFDDVLTAAFDDLADLTEENPQSSVEDPKIGLQASLCMEEIR
jgi:hypothetical protein